MARNGAFSFGSSSNDQTTTVANISGSQNDLKLSISPSIAALLGGGVNNPSATTSQTGATQTSTPTNSIPTTNSAGIPNSLFTPSAAGRGDLSTPIGTVLPRGAGGSLNLSGQTLILLGGLLLLMMLAMSGGHHKRRH
jgi:hypothetical protein